MKLKTIKTIIIALLLVATPTLVFNFVPSITKVNAIEDVTPPVLHDIWVTPSTINDGESVTVYASITDDLSGVGMTTASLTSPSEAQSVIVWFGYNSTSGLFEDEVTIPQYSETGTWTVSDLYTSDNIGNNRRYYNSVDYTAEFTVTTLPLDITPPVLNDVWVSPSRVIAGERVTVYADVTDDLSDVEVVTCYLQSPNKKQQITAVCTYNSSSGLWESEVQIPEDSKKANGPLPEYIA